MKIQILSENRANQPECLAEHGLSVYIETGGRKILFDLGASDLYRYNARRLGVDLEQVDTVVISHGHYDHTGGVPSFCQENQKAKIYIHEKAFATTYGLENGKPEAEPCSIRWTQQQHTQVAERLCLTSGAVWLTEDIAISGTIPEGEDCVATEVFYQKNEDGSLTVDPMEHEQFLAVRLRYENGNSRGFFIFSGCSHKGVIPCIRYAKTLFPGERMLGLLAGMHLYNSNAEMRKSILERTAAEELEYVMPVHCTGILAICELKQLLGERCFPAGTGDTYCL